MKKWGFIRDIPLFPEPPTNIYWTSSDSVQTLSHFVCWGWTQPFKSLIITSHL